jgi:hypothetical protein
MALTKHQKTALAEAVEIARLTKTDLQDIDKIRPQNRLIEIKGAVGQLAIGKVVSQHTLIDEIMADTIIQIGMFIGRSLYGASA